MSFDRVARHYRLLETVVFGMALQRARTCFLGDAATAKRVLIVGEGNGRLLLDLLRESASVQVDCVDASAAMLELARQRVKRHLPASLQRVNFIHSRLEDWKVPERLYDLIVTHFFLDCFAAQTLAELVVRLAAAGTLDAQWLIADFCHPPRGWRRLQARALIAAMYFFFRAAAGIEARRLVDYSPFVQMQGFILTNEIFFRHGEIRSQIWRRSPSSRAKSRDPAVEA